MPGDPRLENRTPIWRWSDLSAALGWLTVLPLRRPDLRSEAFGRATLAFPLVGLLIGAVLAALNWLIVDRLPPWLSSTVLVAVWEALRWDQSGSRDRALLGASAFVKIVCLSARTATRPPALLFAPMLACWSVVVLATGARHAHTPAQKFNASITFREFALTSVFAFAVVFGLAEATGMLVVVCVAAVSLALRLLAHRWARGISWPFLQASALGMETTVIALFALL